MNADKQVPLPVYLKLFAAAAAWGGAFVAGRYLTRHIQPYSAGFIRFASASLLLALLSWRANGKLRCPARKQVLPLVILGLTGVFAYNVFFFKGLKLITAGRASAIIACNPILIALLSALLFREKLNLLNAVGIVVSVTGAVTVVSRGDISSILHGGVGQGELMILGCVASWVTYSLLSKKVMSGLSTLSLVFFSSVVGTACFLPLALSEQILTRLVHYPPMAWVAVVYTGVVATVIAFVWYCDGIKEVGVARAGTFINFVPVTAIVFEYLILREPVRVSLLAGTVLVCTGVYMTSRRSPSPKSTGSGM